MENISTKERNKMAITSGALLGVIYILITAGVCMAVDHLIMFYSLKVIGYVIYIILLGVFASRIKKANGGYMDFKDAFGTIFIMLLVACVLYFAYSFIYAKYIDPNFVEKAKASTVHFMQGLKMPDDKIEETTQKIDKQIAESKTFNLGNNLLSFFGSLLLDCLFGLIVAAIVKKNKPLFDQ